MMTAFKRLFSNAPSVEGIRRALDVLPAARYVSNFQILPKGKVIVTLEVPRELGAELEPLRAEAERALKQVRGVKYALVILTAERPAMASGQGEERAEKIPAHLSPSSKENKKPTPLEIHGIKKFIAVTSGKGGVGKSTVAANIAAALAARGLNIGLMDADIYGPSVPRLFGVRDAKPDQNDDKKLIPIMAHNVKLMSMGFMVAEESPMIWRGPVVQSAIIQLLRDVQWGCDENPLDVLVIDMPPGTGDTHLTLSQKIKLDGVVVVSTPQDLALIDARKGLEMYRKMNVPILGVVENMSYYCCPNCGHKDDVFGHGGARAEAEKIGVPFLGDVPLNSEIRAASDAGQMIPKYYDDIVSKILDVLK